MSNARNRKRKPGRPKPFRDPKPRILVVTEGEITEPEYIEGFRRACRNQRVSIKIASEHGVPMTLVRTAKQYMQEARQDADQEKDDNLAYDFVWCVFDIDDHPKVADAKVMARDNNIDLAISNPCIELWLLLHFRDSPGMQHRKKIKEMLQQYATGYDKHVDFRTFAEGYSQAVTRAERMDRDAVKAGEPERNPTTGVYKLTELIRTK